jgi:hypothetical protein
MIEEIEERLKCYGHVRRMGKHRWTKKILQWHPPCRRKRGRPPEDWTKQVEMDMHRRGLEDDEWQNREVWRGRCERRPREL